MKETKTPDFIMGEKVMVDPLGLVGVIVEITHMQRSTVEPVYRIKLSEKIEDWYVESHLTKVVAKQ